MILLLKIAATNIYEFCIDGLVTAPEVADFYKQLQEKAKQESPLQVLGTLSSFPGLLSFIEASKQPEIQSQIETPAGRYAFVSDKRRMRVLPPFAGLEMRGSTMKHFSRQGRLAAIAWLEQGAEADAKNETRSSMQVQHIEDTNRYQFTIDGELDEAGLMAVYTILKTETHGGKVRFACRF